ncbi:serine integrase [Arthrobacter phage VResidence]|uniref:Serine integrase n=1 Tax=Arthrobacter phage VResidence TaxID=2927294 RepID=A0A9X9P6U4_9CAUD|nr:serine integrase [Arthrobacter phage VResidence]
MNASRKAPRAVLYLRLSAVVDDSTSIDRQERDLRAHAERQGWTVERVLVDEGISGRKARAKAAEAVRLIADEEADVLAVWKLDRFTRQGWDGLGELSRALDRRKHDGRPALFVALQDGLTSDQSAFRLIAGVLSEVARSEADNAAARIKNSISYRKTTTNKYAGGAAVPFGYRSIPAPDGVGRVLIHDPEEAAIVREVAARILEGVEPLSRIGADLQARGVPTSKSPARRALRSGEPADGLDRGIWRTSTLRSLFTSDLLLGRVKHHGDLIRDADGLPASVWPPLLDLATLEALRARLKGSEDRPKVKGRAARLLSGLAYCAVCDSRMYVTTSSGKPIYACASSWNSGSCPSPKINALGLEDHVSARFLAFAGDWPEVETITEADSSTTEATLREVEAALREATAAMLEDDADLPAIAARIGALKARRAELRALPAVTSSRTVPTGRTLAEAWAESGTDDVKRSLLLEALDSVTIAPATSRRSPIDPERVTFLWNS